MDWTASVLTGVSSDTEPTIIVTFDSAKYIFNAGENTNRAFLQSRSNWKRTRGIFFTEIGTKRCSGLPGLLMSFADATIRQLSIVGPPGLLHFISAMRSYTYRDSLGIDVIESSWNLSPSVSPDPLYKDSNITVYAIPILPSLNPKIPPIVSSLNASPETGSKRKRSPSLDLPEKRPALATSLTLLEELKQSSNFAPEHLEAERANEWRRLMINTMFPVTRAQQEEKDSRGNDATKGQGAGSKIKETSTVEGTSSRQTISKKRRSFVKNVQHQDIIDITEPDTPPNNNDPTSHTAIPPEDASSDVDSYRRVRPPDGFYNQLPKFTSHAVGPLTASSSMLTLAYLIVGPRIRGKFNVDAATALGVPFGPLRGQLTRGNTVTFNIKVDGKVVERTVRPEECIGEGEPPGAILIFDVPNTTHIPVLLSSFENSPFYSKLRSRRPEDVNEHKLRTIFHICGQDILEDHRYITFMNSFPTDVQHAIASRKHSPDPVTFTSVAFNQLRFNQLDPGVFPLPKFSLSPKQDLKSIAGLPPRSCLLAANQVFNMRTSADPTFREAQDSFHAAAAANKPPNISLSTSEKFAIAREDIKKHLASGNTYTPKGADVKIIPLGTGSAIPSKYRNVSSTLIQIPNWGNILLDVGEGTWGQLVRQFGLHEDLPNNVWDVLRDLKCIYVSHIHGDHHMGLANILAKRRLLDPPPSSPLYLVTLRAVHLYIREVSDLQDLGLNDASGNGIVLIMSESLHWKSTGAYQTRGMWQLGGSEAWTDFETSQRNVNNMCRDLGLERFSTVDVLHRTRCYGAVIKHTDGWSIVFSGDTKPTNTLVWAGRNTTLLIHEATMADDQSEAAKKKAHSTIGQALDIGKRMNAEHILLTHFSARYPKMPPSVTTNPGQISTGESGFRKPIVALAFDHANLTIGDMWKLNYYLPALEQSFLDTATEEGDAVQGDDDGGPEMDVIIE